MTEHTTPAAPVYAVGDCHVGDCRRPGDHRGRRHGEPTPAEARAAAKRGGRVERVEPVDIFADAPWYNAETGEARPVAGECGECGEDLHPGTPCRTVEEILAECAPPADYAANFRAARAASFARLDANRPGATPTAA